MSQTEFRGGNLRQPGAVPFPTVAPLAPVPNISALGEAIGDELRGRQEAKAEQQKSSVFAEVAEANIEASILFGQGGEALTELEKQQLAGFNSQDEQARQIALQNPAVRATLDKVDRIRQARNQARTAEDYERYYLQLADINKQFINDHPQFADVVLKASQAALGFDPLEKAIGLEQAESLKQQEFFRAQEKSLVEKANSAGLIDFNPDGTFDTVKARDKGQALAQQEYLLDKAKKRADVSTLSEPERKRIKFSGYVNSVLPLIEQDIAAFGAHVIEQYPQLENDPNAARTIAGLWSQKRQIFLAHQNLEIAKIDDPQVQADARNFLEQNLAVYDNLLTGDYSTLKRLNSHLDTLKAKADIAFHEGAPIAARLTKLGPAAETLINNLQQSDPAFYDKFAKEVTAFANGDTNASTPKHEIETFIQFAEGVKPLSSLTPNEARSVVSNARRTIDAMAKNPSAATPEELATYGRMALQLTAIADERDLPVDELGRAVETLSSPSKLGLFQRYATDPGNDPETVRELAAGLERINQKNINAQAARLREINIPGSSPQFESRFGFSFQPKSAKPVFNSATGRVEIQGNTPAKEIRDRVRSINNSLDAVATAGEHVPSGLDSAQVRQFLADSAGIETVGQRIELPEPKAAPAPAAAAPVAPRSEEELLQEFIRLGREGNAAGIQALLTRARSGGAAPATPVNIPSSTGVSNRVEAIRDKINATASQVGVDADLLARLVNQESRGNPSAVSPVGARGLTQLMPATAEELGVDPDDPDENLFGGALYLKRQLERFGGDVRKALAAYNWGPSNVSKAIRKHGDQWDKNLPAETEDYLKKILEE